MMKLRVAIGTLASLFVGFASAQETPSIGRGIALDKLYQFGDVDSVDLQSGALSIAIPIGTSYPVSERFSYDFSLTHSSRVWDYLPAESGYIALPNRRSNSGIGWSLHLGLLIHPSDPSNPAGTTLWKYISPEDGEHEFHATLHSGENYGDTTNSVDYTRDSTYLRLKHLAGDVHEVEFPDGRVKKFQHQAGRPTFEYRLTEIRDPFLVGSTPQNWVRIAYDDVALTWAITDSRGRGHTVKFVSLQYDTSAKPMVDYVDLAAFDGSPGRWNISYLGGGSSTIFRDCRENNGTTLSAPVLASVSRPDGTAWSIANYDENPEDPKHPEFGRIYCKQSVVSDLTYPSGGSIQYDYQTLQLPANDPCPDPLGTGEVQVLAISSRSFVDTVVENPAPPAATWEYEYFVNSPGLGNICGGPELEPLPPEELTVTVWSPLNDRTDYFFSVWPAFTASPNGFLRSEYGLPFTRYSPVGGRFLSSTAYDCAGNPTTCVPKRFEYVLYEQDTGGTRANRRVQARRTVYDDDNGTFADTAYSNFSGVGAYRQTTLSGDFASGNDQTEFTNFDSARGTYPGSYTVLPITDPWVLGTYDHIDVTGGPNGQAPDTARSTFIFDGATGFMKSSRTYRTLTSAGVNDLYTVYCRDAMGNVTSEHHYGGDGTRFELPSPLPHCDSGPPADAQYRLDHTYSAGVRKSSI